MPTGSEIYRELMAEGAKRGLTQSTVSVEVFGNQAQMSCMKTSQRPVRPRTLTKAHAWLNGEPIPVTKPIAEEGDGPTFGCGHPRTEENTQTVGIGNGVRCRICRRKIANKSRQKKAEPEPRPFDIQQPAHYQQADRAERVNARRGAAIRRSIEQRALALVDGDESVKLGGGQVNQVMAAAVNEIRERREAERRQTDPVERAKLMLQRRYLPVCSMAVYGGDANLFCVGRKKDVTEAELLQMARRIAA